VHCTGVQLFFCPLICFILNQFKFIDRRQGKYEAADTLEDCALRSRKDALEASKDVKQGGMDQSSKQRSG